MKTGRRQLGLQVLLGNEHQEEGLGDLPHLEYAVWREALKCWVWNNFFFGFLFKL
jgi:hypothetical protein